MSSITGIEQLKASTHSGYAMRFDGSTDERIKVSKGRLNSDTTGSFSVWFKMEGGTNNYFFSYGSGANVATPGIFGFRVNTTSGTEYLQMVQRSDGESTMVRFRGSTAITVDGLWHHAVLTSSGTAWKIYLDGVEETLSSVAGSNNGDWFGDTTISNPSGTYISAGIWDGGFVTNGAFDGDLDEFSYWDKELSLSEVQEIYNSGMPTDLKKHSAVANLKKWWQLGEDAEFSTNWHFPEASAGIANKKSTLFDGAAEYINIDDLLTNDLSNDTVGTMSIWVKPVDATPASQEDLITFSDTDDATTMQIFMSSSSGKLRIWFSIDGTSGAAVKWHWLEDTATLASNEWSHIVMVQDGTEVKLYIDGVAGVGSFVTAGGASSDKGAWFADAPNLDNGRIGNRSFNGGGESVHFNGNICHATFFKKDLTATQVLNLYNNGNPTVPPQGDLISHYPLGDAPNDTNTVAEDIKGSNNGTGVNLDSGDLEFDSPTLSISENMEEADRVNDVPLTAGSLTLTM